MKVGDNKEVSELTFLVAGWDQAVTQNRSQVTRGKQVIASLADKLRMENDNRRLESVLKWLIISIFFVLYFINGCMFLTRQEKEKRVLELHRQGKGTREIAKEVGMSFGPIGAILRKEAQLKSVCKRE